MLVGAALLLPLLAVAQPFQDHTHVSRALSGVSNYRILLPPDYATSGKRYPVVYYWHSHSDRYTVENHDGGRDTIPRMVRYVAGHDVIVVCPDGYVARDYTGFYGGTPYDVGVDGGGQDFGAYFLELIAHIDTTYRTLADRSHRATSGLSMGGFMSLYLSARYPDQVGSASAFNPGPEFYTGAPGARVLWRPKDHVRSHARTRVRLVRASGDYISQYHEETAAAYASSTVDFEFRRDEYHRHWATSIEETLDFHMRAFRAAALNDAPASFDYDNAYPRFSVWGWDVVSEGGAPGYTCLSGASRSGLRVTTRRWAPDGPPVAERRITIATPPWFRAGATYTLLDFALQGGAVRRTSLVAGADGRLRFQTDGAGHQLNFAGPDAVASPPILLPLTSKDFLRVAPEREIAVPARIYNPRTEPMLDVHVELVSEYPSVSVIASKATIPEIPPGTAVDLSTRLRAAFTSGDSGYARARLVVKITCGPVTVTESIDVLIEPSSMPLPLAVEVLDGRTLTLPVFRQKGNQGGGAALPRELTEGKGNGNGILEPGEEATIWVKLAQGLDALDKNNWHRAKVYTDSPWMEELADIEEQKQREWTGAKERTSLVRLSPRTPPGTVIPLALSNESWSFHFTPDVRYGPEVLYQAFQLHRFHVHRYELAVGGPQ